MTVTVAILVRISVRVTVLWPATITKDGAIKTSTDTLRSAKRTAIFFIAMRFYRSTKIIDSLRLKTFIVWWLIDDEFPTWSFATLCPIQLAAAASVASYISSPFKNLLQAIDVIQETAYPPCKHGGVGRIPVLRKEFVERSPLHRFNDRDLYNVQILLTNPKGKIYEGTTTSRSTVYSA